MIELRLFGICDIRIDGQPLPRMPYRKDLWLLALLALHQGGECPRDWLAVTLWPDADESLALYYLRRSLTHVRRALGPEMWRLRTPTPRTIQLDLADAYVDLREFDQDVGAALYDDQLARAVALYRGPLLADCLEEWILPERSAREQAYLTALETLATRSAERSEPAAAVRSLRLLIVADPYRESAYCALMQALAERGDRAALRQVYHSLRVLLRRDLNTAPAPETEALFRQLSTQAARVIGLPQSGFPRSGFPRSGFPRIDQSAPGKEDSARAMRGSGEISPPAPPGPKHDLAADEAASRLRQARLATLVGPASETRTRLAAAVAEAALPQFEGGVWFVDLAALTDPAELANAIVRTLEVDWEAGSAPAARLASVIAARSLLLVLDHCDHVAQACADLISELLATCAALRVLAACRVPLGVEGEQQCRIPAAALPVQPDKAKPDKAKQEPNGGAVPLESIFYVLRPTDDEFLTAVSRGDSIVLVKGAREMGKSSLLARGLQQARHQGAKVVLTDLQMLGAAAFSNTESLLLALADSLAEQLDLEASPRRGWSSERAPTANMERFVRRDVLGAISGPVVWGLDDMDRLSPPGCAFGNEIFGLFRSWHNRRSLDPDGPWSRLTMAMAYATEAHLFVTDLDQSPFNVGTRLTLSDFTEAQVADLNARYGHPLQGKKDIAAFQGLLGGQPYLTRRGLDEMSRRCLSWERLAAEADGDAGPFGDHLRRLLIAVSQDARLTEVVRDLARGQSRLSAEDFYRLRSAGIVAGHSADQAAFRCRLYQIYFARLLL